MATSRVDSEFEDIADLIFHIDKDITVALQHLRPDLLFMHGAALSLSGARHRPVGPAWYGEVDADPRGAPARPRVLQRRTGANRSAEPDSQGLPSLSVSEIVAAAATPSPSSGDYASRPSLRASGVTCSERALCRSEAGRTDLPAPDSERFDGLRQISPASGAVRVLANALNLLAHPSAGLDAAIHLSRTTPCFELDVTDLDREVLPSSRRCPRKQFTLPIFQFSAGLKLLWRI